MKNEEKIFTDRYLVHISDTELRQIFRSMIPDQSKLLADIKRYHQTMLDLDYEDLACEEESELFVLDVHDLCEISNLM